MQSHVNSENACESSSHSSCTDIGIIRKLKNDCSYRKKIILTLAVFWTYVILGWVILQIGTSLPDLRLLVSIDLEKASWIFSTWSIGYIVGSLICGVLFDKINRLLLMFICSIGTAICSFCLPQFALFALVLTFRFLTGFFCGGLDTGANTLIPSNWGSDAGPAMQALYLCYGIGGIVAPFATEPFMTPNLINNFAGNDTNHYNVTNNVSTDLHDQYILNPTMLRNYSESVNDLKSGTMPQVNTNVTIAHSNPQYNGNIRKAFLMTSVIVLSSAIPYLVMLMLGGFDTISTSSEPNIEDVNEEANPLQDKTDKTVVKEAVTNLIKGKRKLFVLAFVAFINLVYSATEDSLGDFLVTFSLHFLEWENLSCVTLVSVYWVISCIGGLIGVFLARIIRPTKLLFGAHILWIVSFIGMLLASLYRTEIMLWICISGSGLFMTLIIPAVISWTEENVTRITGRISSLFMIATGCGIAANPMFIGYMMETYTYVAFLYILFLESILCFGFYILAIISRYFKYNEHRDVELETI